MNKTYYFQSGVNAHTIVAIRRYSCGHYVANCWINGNKMAAANLRVPAALLAELRETGKLVGLGK